MRITFVFFYSLIFFASVNAQAPAIEWQKSFGGTNYDNAYSIIQTSDGGYAVAGGTGSNNGDIIGGYHGGNDYWIVKTNDTGTIQWQKCLGGSGNDNVYAIIQTTDGGYIVAGNSFSTNGDVTGNHGADDYWVVKTDSVGSIQWKKSLGGSGFDEAYSIIQTMDGGYAVAGFSNSTNGDVTGNHGSSDYWIVKLSSTGAIQWEKSLGGSDYDQAYSIIQTSDSGYAVAGYSNSTNGDVTGNHGTSDYWIVKLSSSGTIQWQKSLGGAGVDQAQSIIQTADGGYAVAGYAYSNFIFLQDHGNGDYWVVKLNSTGTVQWSTSLGGTGLDQAYSIIQTFDGGYVVAGNSASTNGDVTGHHNGTDYWFVKMSSSGVMQWEKSLGGTADDNAQSIIQSIDGGYMVAGWSRSFDGDVTINHGSGQSTADYWIVKLSDCYLSASIASSTIAICNGASATLTASGGITYIWSNSLGVNAQVTVSPSSSTSYSVTVADANHCSASASKTITVYQNPNIPTVTTTGNNLSCSIAGGYQWYLNNVMINGATSQTYLATQSGNYSVVITDNNGCEATSNQVNVLVSEINETLDEVLRSVYPNPASNELFLQTNSREIQQVNIYTTTGALISQTKQPQSKSIDISEFPTGIYVAEIITKDATVRRRWVKI